ncbi:BMA-LDB-1, isoform h [Aphelenchoides bicaudatus]|nr:BMA-LDB-1, isoform h [Aphelenchoides bicaudatus]
MNAPMNGMPGPFPPPTMNPMGSVPAPFLEFRVQEMNNRLSAFFTNRPNLDENEQVQWWNAFSMEFFDDNATITITTLDRNPESRYTIGRILIPRFFRSIFEHGVCELQFIMHNSNEMFGASGNYFLTALSSETGEMVVRLEKPLRAEIRTSARYFIEFAPYDEIYGYRIRAWHLELRQPKESTDVPIEQLDSESQKLMREGLTICGLPSGVVMFLKMSMVLEPMQILMNQCKAKNDMSPQQALKHTIFMEKTRREAAKQQQLLNATAAANSINAAPPQPQPEEPAKKPARKRTRKPPNENGAPKAAPKRSRGGNNANANNQNGPPPIPNAQIPNQGSFPGMNSNFNSSMNYHHEVLVVSEPSMMGTEFGADDERTISRVENAQFDQNSSIGMPPMEAMMNGQPGNMMMPSVMNGSCKLIPCEMCN